MSDFAIVCDIDDTLMLERYYVRSGLEAVGAWALETLGVGGVSEVAWSAFVDGRGSEALESALRICGAHPSREMVREAVEVYRSHRPRIRLEPDALVFLRRAAERGPVAIVADGYAPIQRSKVAALGLARFANPIVYAGDHGPVNRNPSLSAFELAARQIGVSPSRCCYIASNPVRDFSGPKSLGWRTIRVRRLGSLDCAVPSGPEVDCEVGSLDDLEWTGNGLARRPPRPAAVLSVVNRSSHHAAHGGYSK